MQWIKQNKRQRKLINFIIKQKELSESLKLTICVTSGVAAAAESRRQRSEIIKHGHWTRLQITVDLIIIIIIVFAINGNGNAATLDNINNFLELFQVLIAFLQRFYQLPPLLRGLLQTNLHRLHVVPPETDLRRQRRTSLHIARRESRDEVVAVVVVVIIIVDEFMIIIIAFLPLL